MNRHSFIISVFFLFSSLLSSQEIDFRKLSIEEGLSNFVVNDIAIDSKGFLWIATEYGLNKYDGQHFKLYNKSTSPKITNNWINCIFIDSEEVLWLGTNGGGLVRFDPKYETFKVYSSDIHSKDSIKDNVIKCITEDNEGNLWVGSREGLFHFIKDQQRFESFYNDKNDTTSISNDFINAVYVDTKNRLWVGTWNGGLNVMDLNNPNGFVCYDEVFDRQILGGYYKTIVSIYETQDSTIWIGGWGNGVYYYDEVHNTFNNFFEEKNYEKDEHLIIRTIHEDASGNMYFGAFQKGLYIFNKSQNSFSFHSHNEYISGTISSNNIMKIMQDSSGVLWIATVGGGLSYYDMNSETPVYYESQLRSNFRLSSNKVSSALVDAKGRFWITTYDKGVNIVDKKNETVIKLNSQNSVFETDIFFNIVDNKDGTMWLASALGLYIVDVETLKVTQVRANSNSSYTPRADGISDIYRDSEGIIWFGYFAHGISAYYPKEKIYKHYLHDARDSSKLSYNPVNCFYRDKDGIVWFGMELGFGKFNVHTNLFTFYQYDAKDKNSIPEENVQAIFEKEEGFLWLGTHGGGLLRFDKTDETFEQFNVKHNIASDVIKGIESDNKNRLWLATGKGISIFNEKDNSFINLYDNFGYKPVFYNNITRVNDSILVFAGGGVCIVNTNTIKESRYEPEIVIVELSLYNKPVVIGEKINGRTILSKAIEYCDEIKLTYRENVFTLDFAALHFSSPQNIKYKYKLEGFDKEWVYTDAGRARATYTNLKGGQYVFTVFTTNADGVWSKKGKHLKITIVPPLWETLWFRISMLLLLFVLLIIVIKWIIRKQQLEYEKKQADQEHEIIKLKNEKLQAEVESQHQKLQKKSSDLTSLVVSNTRKNEVLLKLKTKLEMVSENVNDQAKREIGRLIREIKQDLNIDENWDQFELHFNEVHNNFIERLKKDFPDLTPANLKMCAYLRMNLSSKEIATLLNISISGVEKSRYRLRKKLSLETEDNLVEFIMNY